MSIVGQLQFNTSKFEENEETGYNDNRNNRRNDNRNKNNNNNGCGNRLGGLKLRSIQKYVDATKNNSGRTNESRKDRIERSERTNRSTRNEENELPMQQAVLDDFTEEYAKNKTDVTVINRLLVTQIVGISSIMTHYYDKRYEVMAESMNNILKLMTTKTFAVSLLGIVKKKEDYFDDWGRDKLNIASLISLALETNHMKMIEETKSIYVEIVQEHIWEFELKELQTKFKLSEDAVLDLLIGIPKFGRDMTDTDIRNCYDNFLTMLINHGKDAVNYMNAEHQKELFYYLFKDDNRIAVKAAGQCLGDDLLVFEEPEDEALYNEYIKMLYSVVNEHDLEEIRVVLRYIVKVRARQQESNSDETTVFSVESAVGYENIKKALLDYIQNSENAKRFLV